jgi:hypothetical protein
MGGPQQATQAPGAQAENATPLVTVSRGDILKALQSPYASPQTVQGIGAELQLSSAQIGALRAGQADLQLTPQQHATMRQSLAQSYAALARDQEKGGAHAQNDQSGSLCGSSSSPAPTTTTAVPAVTATHTGVTETGAGTQLAHEAVGSGTVTVRRDVTGQGVGGNLYAIAYQGADAQNAHWLQFIHREIIGIHGDGTAHPVTGPWSTNSHAYQLTQGGTATAYGTPATGNYNTDAGTSGSDPFYETVGAANRAADSTVMYDRPSGSSPQVASAFSAGANRVISRAHFDTFLVQTDHVTYRVRLTMTYDFSSATATPTPTTVLDGSGAATGLPDAIRDRFHQDWPAYNWLH